MKKYAIFEIDDHGKLEMLAGIKPFDTEAAAAQVAEADIKKADPFCGIPTYCVLPIYVKE